MKTKLITATLGLFLTVACGLWTPDCNAQTTNPAETVIITPAPIIVVPAPVILTPAPVILTPAPIISAAGITALLADGTITIGEPITIKGQTFVVTTNADGNYVIFTTGVGGTATSTPPTTTAEVLQQAQAMVAANNPTNRNYYGTNELVARVGAVYLQNSGQAVVEIGVEKYGIFKSLPQIGIGAAVFQGNNQGKSGTAGAVGFVDYRKIIGDVSFQVGVGGGYDNWGKDFIGVVKADIELRQNNHIGEFVGVGYALSPKHIGDNKGGLMVRGGINYAF